MARPIPALLSINTATVREQWDLPRDHRRLRAPRHPRHLAVARPGREARASRGGATHPRRRPHVSRLLPRRHVPGDRPRGLARRARRQPPRRRRGGGGRRAHASCWSSAGCRRTRAARPRRATSAPRAAWCATASASCSTTRARARMPLAIEPLHPMYAADRACVNTLAQAQRPVRRARARRRRGARRRRRRLPRVVGPVARARDRARRPRTAACSRTTSATGSCRRPTC